MFNIILFLSNRKNAEADLVRDGWQSVAVSVCISVSHSCLLDRGAQGSSSPHVEFQVNLLQIIPCAHSSPAIDTHAFIFLGGFVQAICRGWPCKHPLWCWKDNLLILVLWVQNQYMPGRIKALSIIRLSQGTFGRCFMAGTMFQGWWGFCFGLFFFLTELAAQVIKRTLDQINELSEWS